MVILLIILGFEAEAHPQTKTETKTLIIKLIPDLEIKFPKDTPKKIKLGEQEVYLPVIPDAPKIEIQGLPSEKTNTAAPADWDELIQKYFPMTEWQNAKKIMMAESGGRYDALSKTGDRGLMQISPVHKGRVGGNLNALYSPEINMRVAYEIWSEQGWAPWVCAKKLGIR